MKKTYLLASALMCTAMISAQTKKLSLPAQHSKEVMGTYTGTVQKYPVYNFGQTQKAPGDVIFTETFNGTIGTFTTTGPDAGKWLFDLNGPDGTFSATDNSDKIASATNANGFMIIDADLANPGGGSAEWVGQLVSPVIPMTAFPNAIIEFEHAYRSCCDNAFTLKLEVSINNFATLTSFNVNPDGAAVNTFLGTTSKSVDISTFLAANVANLANFQFRFNWEGTQGGSNTSHYFWQVDDIKVLEKRTNDLQIFNTRLSSGLDSVDYYSIPANQKSLITVFSGVRNLGLSNQNNVKLNVTATGTAVETAVSAVGVVSTAGAIDSSKVLATWLPAGLAGESYAMSYNISQTEVDQNSSSNTFVSAPVKITSGEYARDNNSPQGLISALGTAGDLIIGNVMGIIADDNVTGMSIRLGSTATNVGQTVEGEIWKFNPAVPAWEFFAATNPVVITAANNNTTITFTDFFVGPQVAYFPVLAGESYLVMAKNILGTGAQVTFRTAQSVVEQSVLGVSPTDGTIYFLSDPEALMVRLQLDPSASLNTSEAIVLQNMYPNPTTGKTQLSLNLLAGGDVNVTVVDLAGKIVSNEVHSNMNAGNQTIAINSESFAAGVYQVNVSANGATVTQKLIKK
jgi:hypothetical protein